LPPPLAPPAPPPPPPIHTSSPSRRFLLRSRWRVRHWTGDQAHRQPRPRAESDGEPSEARALEANESTTAYVTQLVVSRQYCCATRVRVEPAAPSSREPPRTLFDSGRRLRTCSRRTVLFTGSSMAWRRRDAVDASSASCTVTSRRPGDSVAPGSRSAVSRVRFLPYRSLFTELRGRHAD
jgi:hypothetical protein